MRIPVVMIIMILSMNITKGNTKMAISSDFQEPKVVKNACMALASIVEADGKLRYLINLQHFQVWSIFQERFTLSSVLCGHSCKCLETSIGMFCNGVSGGGSAFNKQFR